MTNKTRVILLIATIILVIASIIFIESYRVNIGDIREQAKLNPNPLSMNLEEKKQKYRVAKEIVQPSGFLNTESINVMDQIGKNVVLVDFMTYSCINCQRTFPYLNAWNEKYKDKGLQIIGIHTPEFDFEKDIENVRDALKRYGIEYPVILDNDYATWNAYGNRYWPHKYLIDIDGFIVYDHIGEGGYEKTEKIIQELLKERSEALELDIDIDENTVTPKGVESIAKDVDISPEIYFGANRNEYLYNGYSGIVGEQNFEEQSAVKSNTLYLRGTWDIQPEFAENKTSDAKIIFKFNAKNVFMVASAEEEVTLELKIDGKPLDKGIVVQDEKLYRLVEGDEHGEHTLEITVKNPGLKVFTFTFG